MNSVFNEQILADKLSKLNSTQQCIETLSHWCIFHQKKAELVIQTWDKQFHSSQKEQKIPFLYLANDILQNSRRKGTEFVSEFWKVLPAALKDVLENGDEHGKNVVSRLVGIWEERKVFGSRARGLKEIMLGKEPQPPLQLNTKKRSRSVRIVRRDSRSIKIKLAIGGTPEKIVSAFHSVLSEHQNEGMDLNKCKAAVHRVGKLEKDVEIACRRLEDPRRATLADELQEEETILKQCTEKLKSVEETRVALVSQLKDALREQESELENVRTQLQVAQAQIEEASKMRRRLNNDPTVESANPTDPNASAGEASKKTAAAIAAEVADKLAASTYSQQIMTSVLSSFAAEEAMNAGLVTSSSNPSNSSLENNPKLEKPMNATAFIAAQPLSVPPTHHHQTVLVQQPLVQGQVSGPSQPQYTLFSAPPSQQYLQQPSGGMMISVPYGYGTLASSLPPPPPLPPPHLMNLARPALLTQHHQVPLTQQQPMQLAPQQPMSLVQQQPAPPSFRPLQPPGMGFYTHSHNHQ
ncbi:uncharacterized protein LOC143848334 isoform X2 [Tasmannia lanceolata]|uniref:uncharacterized protein LOC143848334 isoform X2 n=1 Tax=Tasmannia lanceolata TaxID=3420 RepID=UPI0040646495